MDPKNINDILKILPHRFPFLLIDRILEIKPFEKILALKNVTANEPHFMGHFPENPLMPGVLLVEVMAQAGAILLLSSLPEVTVNTCYLLGIDKARFRKKIIPGDQLIIEVIVVKKIKTFCKLNAVIKVDNEVVAEAELLTSADFLKETTEQNS